MPPLTGDVPDSGSFEPRAVGDIAGEFFVPSFQRGYRWTAVEVRQLLDDIRDSDGSTYYLQPVVVKARTDGSWELVDGQQRLTTLYLIFRYLRATHLPTAAAGYSISYETRPGSKDYLHRLDEDGAHNNIDYFHMFNAYRCIEAWFEEAGNRATREALMETGDVFAKLLDCVAGTAPGGLREALRAVVDEFLSAREAESRFDWRYYMAKYPEMREKGSSTYFAEPLGHDEPTMGYCLCMLRAGHTTIKGYYRDPILLAVARRLEDPGVVEDQWFMGYETNPRRLPLKHSGATIRCVPDGFELTPPPLDEDLGRFGAACAEAGVLPEGRVPVPQVEVDGHPIDTADRVIIGIQVVQALAAAGL